jgi:hypothetical protein
MEVNKMVFKKKQEVEEELDDIDEFEDGEEEEEEEIERPKSKLLPKQQSIPPRPVPPIAHNNSPRYELAEVTTQTAVVIKDNINNTVFDQNETVLHILNKLEKIEKAVA